LASSGKAAFELEDGFEVGKLGASGRVLAMTDAVRGEFIFGCSSSFRMTQLLHYSLELPDLPALDRVTDIGRYMVTVSIDAVRTCLRGGGYAQKEEEREIGGTFLVGVRGHLFGVHSDYQIEETVVGYNALGALYATQHADLSPRERLELALQAADYHNCDTRPPFIFVTTGGKDE